MAAVNGLDVLAASVTPPSRVSPRIDAADRILRHVKAQAWPSSREAMAAIGNAADFLAGALHEHARLLSGDLWWSAYDPDLEYFAGDPQDAAVLIAEDKAAEAGVALVRVFAEYQRRAAMVTDGEPETASHAGGAL